MADSKERIKQITDLMSPVIEDNSVPKNIRRAVSEARERINQAVAKGTTEVGVNLANAIYSLDDISNDINMPFHTRTEIWGIVSELEKLKEELK
jgi:uncharacterized protein